MLEEIASRDVVTRTDALRFFGATGVDLAFPITSPGPTDEPLRADELADLLVQLGGYHASLGYLVVPGPRYALRVARRESLFPADRRRLAAGATLDGVTFLRLVREPTLTRLASHAASTPDSIRLRPSPLPARQRGPWFEWDATQTAAATTATETESSWESVTTLSSTLLLTPALELDGTVTLVGAGAIAGTGDGSSATPSDESASVDLQLPRAALTWHIERVRTGRVTVGRQRIGPVVADGLGVALTTAALTVSGSAGATTFVPAALNDLDGDTATESVVQASDTVVAHAQLAFPELIGRQSPSLAVTGLGTPGKVVVETRMALAGSLGLRTFYLVDGAVQMTTGSDAANGTTLSGWESSGSLRWYPGTRRAQLWEATVVAQRVLDATQYERVNATLQDTVESAIDWTIRPARPLRLTAGVGVRAGIADAPQWDGALGRAGIAVQPVDGVIFELNGNILSEQQAGSATARVTIEL